MLVAVREAELTAGLLTAVEQAAMLETELQAVVPTAELLTAELLCCAELVRCDEPSSGTNKVSGSAEVPGCDALSSCDKLSSGAE